MTTRSSAALPSVLSDMRVAIGPLPLAALATATLGGALQALAPAFSIAVADDGTSTAPAFTAAPLLTVLALLPVALAWVLAGRGASGAACGVLIGLAALAPGRAVLDLQLLAAPWRAARPELLVSSSLAPLQPGLGAWSLLAGQVLTVVAGVLALVAVRRPLSGVPAGFEVPAGSGVPGGFDADAGSTPAGSTDAGAQPALAAGPAAPRAGSAALTAALCVAAVVAAGLVAAPFRSTDPYLLPRAAVDAPPLAMAGVFLLAAGVLLAACLAAVAADVVAGRAALAGVGLGVAAVALPPVLAALLDPTLSLSWGPLVALAGAVALAGVSPLVGRERAAANQDVRLPALDRMHVVAGVVAFAAGAFALLGALLDQVSVPAETTEPVLYPARLLVPAGLLLAGLGAALLLGSRPGVSRSGAGRSGLAASVRPAVGVAWAAVALAGMAVLDAALTATQISGVHSAAGVWATAVALLLAPAAGCLAAVAGSVERDEVDLSELRAARPVSAAGLLAAVLAVPAFGLPLMAAPDYAEPGIWSDFQVASWGRLVAALAVAAAALLAPWSRPARAAGLLLGAAAVLAVHLAQLPLTRGRAGADAQLAAGCWVALACLVVLLAGALLAWREHRPTTKYPPGRVR